MSENARVRASTLCFALLCCAIAPLSFAALSGCESKASEGPALAPTASALAATAPKAASAKKFTVDLASGKVEFMMEAPKEVIRGRVTGATTGELQIDPSDLTKTTGLLSVDISGIELYQKVADDAGKFSDEKKSDLQNEHARTWLEISPDAPEDVRKKNSRVEFSIASVEAVGEKDVTKMSGADRKATVKAKGDFLLHGHKTEKTAELEVNFHYEGDKLASVSVKSIKPFAVGLAEHDVRPRDKFGSLAQKTLEVLSPKVAKEALVSVELTAKP